MSTRESMRRELEELAKLAQTMRTDLRAEPRSSGEWSSLGAWSDSGASTATPPPRPSTVTVPPAVHSEPAKTAGGSEGPRTHVWRPSAVLASAIALCAVTALGTIALTVSTSSHSTASKARQESPPSSPADAPAAPVVVAAPPYRFEQHPLAPQVATAGPPTAPGAPAGSVPPSTHVAGSHASAPSKGPSVKAQSPAAAGPQSLDELIRRAVATPPAR
jgi:hypothetical protein